MNIVLLAIIIFGLAFLGILLGGNGGSGSSDDFFTNSILFWNSDDN